MGSFGKWYFVVKFNQKKNLLVPRIHSWHWRTLYMERKHIKNKEIVNKALLMHLFWVMDICKLKHPLRIKGFMGHPTMFLLNIPHTSPLELYGTIHRWKYRYGLKKHQLYPYLITSRWAAYKSDQWVTRTYFTFMNWRKKRGKYYQQARNTKLYHFLNFWFLTNRYYHLVQVRLYCKTYMNPFRYSKVLWLRLLQYPIVYDYRWFFLLTHLTRYRLKNPVPWELLYQSKDTWTFDPTAKILEFLLKALVKHRLSITEYVLIKQWRNLLGNKDSLSKLLQIKIRTSKVFTNYRNVRQISKFRHYITV